MRIESSVSGKKFFITGGAGYLGRHLVRHLIADNEVTVYSRDEAKHYYLKKEFPKVNCVVGDVRNYDLMKRASVGHDVGVFAASLKQIGAVDSNVEESIQVIIHGAINSRRVAEENDFESACFISTDKSRAATTLYGAMKFVANEAFIVNADEGKTKLSSALYGNVLNSTGSVIPLIWDSIRKDYELTLYSEDMTRFVIDIDAAIELVLESLNHSGFNLIPRLKSMRIKDLFELYRDEFGLKFSIGVPRISEKIHEMMVSDEEAPRTFEHEESGHLMMHYKHIHENHLSGPYTSDQVVMSKGELRALLVKSDWFR